MPFGIHGSLPHVEVAYAFRIDWPLPHVKVAYSFGIDCLLPHAEVATYNPTEHPYNPPEQYITPLNSTI